MSGNEAAFSEDNNINEHSDDNPEDGSDENDSLSTDKSYENSYSEDEYNTSESHDESEEENSPERQRLNYENTIPLATSLDTQSNSYVDCFQSNESFFSRRTKSEINIAELNDNIPQRRSSADFTPSNSAEQGQISSIFRSIRNWFRGSTQSLKVDESTNRKSPQEEAVKSILKTPNYSETKVEVGTAFTTFKPSYQSSKKVIKFSNSFDTDSTASDAYSDSSSSLSQSSLQPFHSNDGLADNALDPVASSNEDAVSHNVTYFLRNAEQFQCLNWLRFFKKCPGITIQCKQLNEDLQADAMVVPGNSFGFMDGEPEIQYSMIFGWNVQKRLQKIIWEKYDGELLVGQAITLDLFTNHTRLHENENVGNDVEHSSVVSDSLLHLSGLNEDVEKPSTPESSPNRDSISSLTSAECSPQIMSSLRRVNTTEKKEIFFQNMETQERAYNSITDKVENVQTMFENEQCSSSEEHIDVTNFADDGGKLCGNKNSTYKNYSEQTKCPVNKELEEVHKTDFSNTSLCERKDQGSEKTEEVSKMSCEVKQEQRNEFCTKETIEEMDNKESAELCKSVKYIIYVPVMRVPSLVQETVNAYLAFRAVLQAVQKHNNNAISKNKIHSVICPALCAGIGGMPSARIAFQMKTAYDTFALNQRPDLLQPTDFGRMASNHVEMTSVKHGSWC